MRSLLQRARFQVAALAALAVLGCEGQPSGPGLDPGASLTVADIEGSWTVQVPRTVACLPNREPFAIRLDLQHSSLAEFLGVESEEYFNGAWWVDAVGERFSLQGWVQMEKRTFRILLWQGVHAKGSVFIGRFLAGGHLSASLQEPIPPGSGWAADPIPGYPGGFAIGSCEWRVEGERPSS